MSSRSVPLGRAAAPGLAALAALAFAGCNRLPLPEICPPVTPGELVLTELRGPQLIPSTGKPGTDALGEWIELANVSGRDVSLYGLHVVMTDASDGHPVELRVADGKLVIPDQGYAVLGRFTGALPDYVDYGYGDAFQGSLYAAGYLRLESCGTLLDAIRWDALPTAGTLAWTGATAPDANRNDDATKTSKQWCNDQTPDAVPDGGTPGPIPGTPGRVNRPCP